MRILVVTSKPPLPQLLTGGGQRTDLLLRALRTCGDVELLLITQTGLCTERELAPVVARHRVVGRHEWTTKLWAGPWRFPAGWLPGLPSRIAEALARQDRHYGLDRDLLRRVAPQVRRGNFDLVVTRPLEPALRCGLLGLDLPVVADVDDLESETLRQRFAAAAGESALPRAIERLLVRRLQAVEARAFRACAHVWLASEDDDERTALPRRSVLPNIPWLGAADPPPAPRPARPGATVIVFVGNLAYEPNADGVTCFVDVAWPRVRAAVPGAVLRLVGPLPSADLQRRWRSVPGVELTGFVDDLTPVYDAAALTVAPLTWGGGTNIKVLESLTHGRACVLTARTLRGFRFLRHDESVWCADDVAGMAEGCIRLLRDPARRDALAERGRREVAAHASLASFTAIVRRTLETVMPGRRAAVGPNSGRWA